MRILIIIAALAMTACAPHTLPYREHGTTFYDSLQRQEEQRRRAMMEFQRTQAMQDMAWSLRFRR